ncbi:MAG: glycoside hydrolase family 125 protein [Clostridia bacterium]|nr:glycoside hydrolase family 125 protein [Clostridia bacterium]
MQLPDSLIKRIDRYSEKLERHPKLRDLYRNCCASTLETAVRKCDDGTYFVLTGDIPAMWLRDSSAQVSHYIPLANDPEISEIIEGVLKRQFMYIRIDPYANAFNQEPNGEGHPEDLPKNNPWVFERKYEVDSLCYPLRLLYLYYKQTGKTEIIRNELESVMRIILNQWRIEQRHEENSPYYFIRLENGITIDDYPYGGRGAPAAYTGMTRSAFRPSDDGCVYGYLTASEMFAVVVLGYAAEMLSSVCNNESLAAECDALRKEIDDGIRNYCIVEHGKYGRIYACETDGMGHYSMIDDANVPSLLSIPYIGYSAADDEIYLNTRRFLLSADNPYYYSGKYARGIGSPHTPRNYVWHMSLIMQGLTSTDDNERRELLKTIASTEAGKCHLHEGFDVDNPCNYTREWFTWPEALFSEFIENCVDNNCI